jgi:hypothetical protein
VPIHLLLFLAELSLQQQSWVVSTEIFWISKPKLVNTWLWLTCSHTNADQFSCPLSIWLPGTSSLWSTFKQVLCMILWEGLPMWFPDVDFSVAAWLSFPLAPTTRTSHGWHPSPSGQLSWTPVSTWNIKLKEYGLLLLLTAISPKLKKLKGEHQQNFLLTASR